MRSRQSPSPSPSPAPDAVALSAAARAMADVLERYHTVPPEDLGDLVAEVGAQCGAEDCVIYLQDYAQDLLVPLPVAGREGPPLPIGDSVAGSAFVEEDLRDEVDGDAIRMWVPLLDGTDRVGVFRATVDPADPAARWFVVRLAALASLFIVSKAEISDHFFWTKRRVPMSLSAEMQWQLLPALTVATPRVAIAGVIEPAYDVGGDAFDYAINGDVAHVAIVDAMGHGLQASQMAAVAVGSYRHSRRQRLGLVDTHGALDDALARQFGEDRFATAQLAELHLGRGELTMINAGHPAPLVVSRGGGSRTVRSSPALPVGLAAGQIPRPTTVALEPGDRLLFFTDGVVENRLSGGAPYGEDRLRAAFAEECAAGRTASETVRRLSRSFLALHEGETRDDATWVLVEWRGPGDGTDGR